MTTIPASAIVNVIPGVVSAGGTGLSLIGLSLTNNPRVPIGTVSSFASQLSVSNFFGASSQEAALAATYFTGQQNATQNPAALLFAQYASSAVAAYLRGGNTSSLTLAQLQALSGNLGVSINGVLSTASISLAAATSFSNAASIIGNALGIQGVQIASFTGSIAGVGGSGAGTTLTISALSSGTLTTGAVVQGTGVTAGTYITGQLTGSAGGTGTYSVSVSQFALSAAMTGFAPAVSFDSVSNAFIITSSTTGNTSTITFGTGALATSLFLTQITGAVLSQGTGAATPGPFMTALTQITQNWATFFTAFNPDAVNNTGNAQKLLFAQWASQQSNRYAYLCWDSDASPTASAPATASLGYLIGINGSNYSGTSLWYDPNNEGLVAAVSGAIAQLNFNATNGRNSLAFNVFAGLSATVTSQTVAANLLANGYNFYGAYGTANQNFVYTYNASISGAFLWLDSYINQIWMNSQFQLALMGLLGQVLSIPYTIAGVGLIDTTLSTPIQQALNFGAIRAGVTLSASETLAINQAAGSNVAPTVANQGWYLQVLLPPAASRAARTTPIINFWYADGGAIQQLTMASLEVQ